MSHGNIPARFKHNCRDLVGSQKEKQHTHQIRSDKAESTYLLYINARHSPVSKGWVKSTLTLTAISVWLFVHQTLSLSVSTSNTLGDQLGFSGFSLFAFRQANEQKRKQERIPTKTKKKLPCLHIPSFIPVSEPCMRMLSLRNGYQIFRSPLPPLFAWLTWKTNCVDWQAQ